jgi:hypothetical protein
MRGYDAVEDVDELDELDEPEPSVDPDCVSWWWR